MRIGSIEAPYGLFLAPMEDVTDQAFRRICRRLGAEVVTTEFVSSEGLVRDSRRTERKMFFCEEERPLGIQLYGPDLDNMARAAQLAEALAPDFIDINCGCWVKNVALAGAGAGLLRDLPQMERIARSVVGAVKIPVTLKTRLGWDARSIRIVEVAQMCEQAGIAALAIHCRTRDQGHDGAADYSWIARIKESVSIPVIVNGSVTTPEQVGDLFATTGCDGVMIGRAALRNPWIFQQTRHYLQTGQLLPDAGVVERLKLLREHAQLALQVHGDRYAAIRLRKYYAGYLHGIPGSTQVRLKLMALSEMQPLLETLEALVEQTTARRGAA
ncbi:MAG: tRNA dihydrouridine synthase DusB [Acidobacteriota bacterium]